MSKRYSMSFSEAEAELLVIALCEMAEAKRLGHVKKLAGRIQGQRQRREATADVQGTSEPAQ